MEYKAIFGIDCGVSLGFGMKYPHYEEQTKTISANDSQVAYKESMFIAEEFADDYLSNPKTDLTTVKLLSLKSPKGEVSFDASKSVVKRSMLEHLLALASGNAPNK